MGTWEVTRKVRSEGRARKKIAFIKIVIPDLCHVMTPAMQSLPIRVSLTVRRTGTQDAECQHMVQRISPQMSHS